MNSLCTGTSAFHLKGHLVAEDSYSKKIIAKGADVVPFVIFILFRTGACILLLNLL